MNMYIRRLLLVFLSTNARFSQTKENTTQENTTQEKTAQENTTHDFKNEETKSQVLKIKDKKFSLKGKPFRIMSGSLHYFRVPSDEWNDRLLKLKAMGLNTVDIYIPWNLHEPRPGEFNFRDSDINIVDFLKLVSSHELYAIVRPGPYICTEWDLGGLPSWLLRDKNMKLRSMYPGFIKAVKRYFSQLFPLLLPFQMSRGGGGPIIAFQIENEYGVYGNDTKYMEYLKNLFEGEGVEELMFVCDNEEGLGKYHLKGVLQTINFMSRNAKRMITKLKEIQPDKPVFVTEFWCGWFDHWGERHHKVKTAQIIKTLKYIINQGGSFNFYMWHGGTNFGFMNGANADNDGSNYQATITSYDYDAPVSETGDAGDKFDLLRSFMVWRFSNVTTSDVSPFKSKYGDYGEVVMKQFLSLDDILRSVAPLEEHLPVCMENLNIGKDYGQSYGYIVYETNITRPGSVLKIKNAKDFVIVIYNNIILSTGSLHQDPLLVDLRGYDKAMGMNRLQILVENSGRVNYGNDIDNQRKGILGSVYLDKFKLVKWKIYPLQFDVDWVKNVTLQQKHWKNVDSSEYSNKLRTPSLFRGNIRIDSLPRKTFLTFSNWYKGSVYLNGINLGRYWDIGPQKTLFVPAQFLHKGDNSVLLFDLHGAPRMKNENDKLHVTFTEKQDLGEKSSKFFLI